MCKSEISINMRVRVCDGIVLSDCSGTEKPRPEKSGRGGNMRDTGNQPLTEPAVTPLMMNLLRQMYTTTTGRMASRMNMYTLPMSNLE